jgi:hypothetical protein
MVVEWFEACDHQQIYLKWVTNHNSDVVKHFIFVLNGENIWAHLGVIYSEIGMMLPVTQKTIAHVLQLVKVDYKRKIPNQFVPDYKTFRLIRFKLEYLLINAENRVVG